MILLSLREAVEDERLLAAGDASNDERVNRRASDAETAQEDRVSHVLLPSNQARSVPSR